MTTHLKENDLDDINLEDLLILQQILLNFFFIDSLKVFISIRIITSSYRFLPERNVHISKHAVRDEVCNVGIIISDSEHAVVFTPLVQVLSHGAAQVNPKVSGIRYKVYVVEKMEKYYTKTLNSVKVTFSTMRCTASKC